MLKRNLFFEMKTKIKLYRLYLFIKTIWKRNEDIVVELKTNNRALQITKHN
jgi:hypothetical protein